MEKDWNHICVRNVVICFNLLCVRVVAKRILNNILINFVTCKESYNLFKKLSHGCALDPSILLSARPTAAADSLTQQLQRMRRRRQPCYSRQCLIKRWMKAGRESPQEIKMGGWQMCWSVPNLLYMNIHWIWMGLFGDVFGIKVSDIASEQKQRKCPA